MNYFIEYKKAINVEEYEIKYVIIQKNPIQIID